MQIRDFIGTTIAWASENLPKCPSPRRRIVQENQVPPGWIEKPLFNRDHWGGGIRKDGSFDYYVRPTNVWKWLHYVSEGDWRCTVTSAFFECEADARLFMEIEWFRSSSYVVARWENAVFPKIDYAGDDGDEAVLVKMSTPNSLLWSRS